MRVLIDTPVWSLALRRKPKALSPEQRLLTQELASLIRRDEAALVGAVRQEVLSGIGDAALFKKLRDYLRDFPDEPLDMEDFEEAAQASNKCRAAGVAGSGTDFLLCAVALRHDLDIFTLDGDFQLYARHLPLRLHASHEPPS